MLAIVTPTRLCGSMAMVDSNLIILLPSSWSGVLSTMVAAAWACGRPHSLHGRRVSAVVIGVLTLEFLYLCVKTNYHMQKGVMVIFLVIF